MKTVSLLVVALALAGGALSPVSAQELVAPETARSSGRGNVFGRAVQWERAITSTTGMAISPLLGMGVLGVIEWFQASEEERANLPWYGHPAVWGVALGVFGLSTLKDTFGIVVPEAAKKPLTVVEVLENKLSAVIVALAVIPASVAAQFPPPEMAPSASAGGGGPVLAVLPIAGAPFLISLGLVVMFGVVFLVSHACKCLLLLSPSSFITAGLRGTKGLFLVGFAGTAYLAPWAGVGLSLAIVAVCLLLSGWAFRWNVFGWLFLKDFLGSRFQREVDPGAPLTGFATSALPGVKPRTYGEIRREGEDWVFSYRPWLIFARREVRWKSVTSGLRVGLLAPALTMKRNSAEGFVTVLDFRLRFYGQGDVLARRLSVDERQPSRVIQGMQAAWTWFREQLGGGVVAEA
jgi:hypothetical protein